MFIANSVQDYIVVLEHSLLMWQVATWTLAVLLAGTVMLLGKTLRRA